MWSWVTAFGSIVYSCYSLWFLLQAFQQMRHWGRPKDLDFVPNSKDYLLSCRNKVWTLWQTSCRPKIKPKGQVVLSPPGERPGSESDGQTGPWCSEIQKSCLQKNTDVSSSEKSSEQMICGPISNSAAEACFHSAEAWELWRSCHMKASY